jgi:hypothetical protein
MKSTDPANDYVSSPPKEPIVLTRPHAVGDKVSFTMPWMGGRDVYVAGKIMQIEGENALLTTIGFFDAGDSTGIEPLANLHPWTTEDKEHLKSFDAPVSFSEIEKIANENIKS